MSPLFGMVNSVIKFSELGSIVVETVYVFITPFLEATS